MPVVLLGLALAVGACTAPLDEAEVARRAAASRPTWASYQEDVKGQIGARPVAEWSATLEEVRAGTDGIRVTFRLKGPWADREAVLPVMMRDDLADARLPASALREGPRVTYVFAPATSAGPPPAWIELRYPRHERRIMLSSSGTWRASD